MENQLKTINLKFPSESKKKYKYAAAKRGVTLTQLIRDYLDSLVEEDEQETDISIETLQT